LSIFKEKVEEKFISGRVDDVFNSGRVEDVCIRHG